MKASNIKRNCPKCGIELLYSSKNIYRAIKLNSLCRSCSKTGKSNPSFGKECRNKEQLKQLNKGNKYNSGKYRTDAQRKIHSEKMKAFCRTEKGQDCIARRKATLLKTRALLGTNGYHPNFNKTACSFFDYLNDVTGWNGRHALNGKEYYISELGYWVDYYVPEQNIVIEWDENREWHFNKGERIKKDIIRENKIKKHLKCKFLRVSDKTGKDYEQIKNFILDMLSQ